MNTCTNVNENACTNTNTCAEIMDNDPFINTHPLERAEQTVNLARWNLVFAKEGSFFALLHPLECEEKTPKRLHSICPNNRRLFERT